MLLATPAVCCSPTAEGHGDRAPLRLVPRGKHEEHLNPQDSNTEFRSAGSGWIWAFVAALSTSPGCAAAIAVADDIEAGYHSQSVLRQDGLSPPVRSGTLSLHDR
jgi:hypothetical protein